MARISGINIPDNKRIVVALTYIFGIGKNLSSKILTEAKIGFDRKPKDLSESELDLIRGVIEKKYKSEGDLRIIISQNIKRLKEIGSYRGTRHTRKLPCRGQRTKTNARTKRGKRVCVGSGRKSASEKT